MRLHDFFDYHAREHPQRRVLEFGGRTLSYAEAAAQSHRMARALLAAGLAPGDRFGLLAKNSLEYLLFFYAGSKAGVVPVPLNYRLAPPEWAYIVNDAGARAGRRARRLRRGPRPAARELRRREDAGVALGRARAAGLGGLPGLDRAATRAAARARSPRHADDDLYQMYTSGTTGRPKGAVLHPPRGDPPPVPAVRRVLAAAAGRARARRRAALPRGGGAHCASARCARAAPLVIHEDFVPAERGARALGGRHHARDARAGDDPGLLVAVPDVAQRRYDDLRLIVYGASPIAGRLLRRAIEVFGCDFVQGYGMTETTAALTT